MGNSYTQQSGMPPPVDSSIQGAPGSPQMPGAMNPQLMGIQAQQPIPQPGAGQYVNPALAQSVIGLNSLQSQQGGIDRQRKLADALRADSKDQLQGQQAGRVFKSAGIANLAASLAQNYGAMKLGQRADTAQTGMNDQRNAAMQDYFNALTGQQQPAQ